MNNKPLNNKVEYELDNSTRYKMSIKKQGSRNPNYGKPRDAETCRKISDSQRKRHSKIRAFNEISEMSATKRIWEKVRFTGYCILNLIKCHDVCALYEMQNLAQDLKTEGYRVYYYKNDVLNIKDFSNLDDADTLYRAYQNPDVEIICNENKRRVYVLGVLKGHAENNFLI